ncbi:hypothetical protein GWO43_27760 [candidate division KSB1 bacterium]|nr:hypothetical protein [candidate division KSB1 bacterium]NIR72988.1 hypothetical protein [candidate division KSB1 bacterium]NIS27741.1 hypothetical protein [candidate division KSB1 bacterium]NIT74589.1 hypothetical protein [candidate division KSB1 bacterium]NIU28408.1 hypothetical protein [candidate division KSB1 bacterium]
MVEIDATNSISLRNATDEELKKAFQKYDHYFDYGPRVYKLEYLHRLGNILQEIRMRKNRERPKF